jgi:hypothetical protein
MIEVGSVWEKTGRNSGLSLGTLIIVEKISRDIHYRFISTHSDRMGHDDYNRSPSDFLEQFTLVRK